MATKNRKTPAPAPGKPAPKPCELWRRLLAMLYDATAVIALLMLATAVAMLAGFREMTALRDPGYSLYLALVWFLYFGLSWRRGGMTLGMRAWRIRIATEDGGLPGWGRCLARFLGALLSAGAAGAGFLWSLLDARKVTWHDLLSGTRLYRTGESTADRPV
jgi:uncharacterized RDD family membrane protein YckC